VLCLWSFGESGRHRVEVLLRALPGHEPLHRKCRLLTFRVSQAARSRYSSSREWLPQTLAVGTSSITLRTDGSPVDDCNLDFDPSIQRMKRRISCKAFIDAPVPEASVMTAADRSSWRCAGQVEKTLPSSFHPRPWTRSARISAATVLSQCPCQATAG